jgi:hypothetical protein
VIDIATGRRMNCAEYGGVGGRDMSRHMIEHRRRYGLGVGTVLIPMAMASLLLTSGFALSAPKDPPKPPIELGDLLVQFLRPQVGGARGFDWAAARREQFPVRWISPDIPNNHRGYVQLLLAGKGTPDVISDYGRGVWEIQASDETVDIIGKVPPQQQVTMAVFQQAGLNLTPYKCHNVKKHDVVIYTVNAPSKNSAWLAYSSACLKNKGGTYCPTRVQLLFDRSWVDNYDCVFVKD